MKMEVMEKLHKKSSKRTNYVVKQVEHKSCHRILDAMSTANSTTELEPLEVNANMEQCLNSALNAEDVHMKAVIEGLILAQREHSQRSSNDNPRRDEMEANHLVCTFVSLSEHCFFFQNTTSANTVKRETIQNASFHLLVAHRVILVVAFGFLPQ